MSKTPGSSVLHLLVISYSTYFNRLSNIYTVFIERVSQLVCTLQNKINDELKKKIFNSFELPDAYMVYADYS